MYNQEDQARLTQILMLRLASMVDNEDEMTIRFSAEGSIAAYFNPRFTSDAEDDIEACDMLFIFDNAQQLLKFCEVTILGVANDDERPTIN